MLSSRFGIDRTAFFTEYDLASRKSVVAAISGGGDSTALLLLLKSHLDRKAPATRLVAATVDHRLRPGSAGEAEAVARLCAALGIEHRSLAWEGPKPATGLPAAAREARHDLLAETARGEGSDLVITAHTADDQAETVLMRQAREEGRGLAGIAPATLFCGATWFARPLLPVRRQALREVLRESGTGWAEDPTNTDLAYERARLRRALAGPGGEARVDTALRLAAEAGAKRRADGESAARLIGRHARQVLPGLIRLDRQLAGEGEAGVHSMRLLLAVAGGRPQLPDSGRTAALVARIAAGEAFRAVLSRCLVEARPAGVFLLREARGLPETMPVADGMVWDGRFRIAGAAPGAMVAPFGLERAGKAASPRGASPQALARAALAAEPLILEPGPGLDDEITPTPDPSPQGGGGPAGTPVRPGTIDSAMREATPEVPLPLVGRGRGGGDSTCDGPALGEIERLIAPWARYLPSFDLAAARALAALVGGAEIPDPPWRRHIGREA